MPRTREPGNYDHQWELSDYTSPSGKIMYQCPVCKLYDPAPVKEKYETRLCVPDKYKDSWRIEDGKVFVNW